MRFESPPCLSRRLRLRLRLLFTGQQLPPALTAATGFSLCWRGPQPTGLIAGRPAKVGKKPSGFGLQECNDCCSLQSSSAGHHARGAQSPLPSKTGLARQRWIPAAAVPPLIVSLSCAKPNRQAASCDAGLQVIGRADLSHQPKPFWVHWLILSLSPRKTRACVHSGRLRVSPSLSSCALHCSVISNAFRIDQASGLLRWCGLRPDGLTVLL